MRQYEAAPTPRDRKRDLTSVRNLRRAERRFVRARKAA